MIRIRQFCFGLAVVAAAMAAPAQSENAVAARPPLASTNLIPPLPTPQSPVNYFRQLLQMSPAERNRALSSRTPEARAHILAKVREYLALSPDVRELRLRATELRWYLLPLLRTPAAERDPQLPGVPTELHDLAKARLEQWDLLPPTLQQEFLANDKALHYFAQAPAVRPPDPGQPDIAAQFDQFLSFTPEEKDKVLRTLSEVERTTMQQTLETFGQLPAQQRTLCVRNYTKFAGMSGTERAEFLKNAENWSKMSPQERQTWRDLVAHVPMWPPMPAMSPPLPPPAPSKPAKSSMATN